MMPTNERPAGTPASPGYPLLPGEARHYTPAMYAYCVAEAARAVIAACAELAQGGYRVLGAHARPGAPLVAIAPPPAGAGLHGALRKRTRYEEVLIDRLPSGVLVQWCTSRRARSMAKAGGVR